MDKGRALSLLGLASDFTPSDLKKTYRLLAAKHHPDVAGAGSTERFKELTEAYKFLSLANHSRAILFTHRSIFTVVVRKN